jgi:hypothetical protein
MRINLNCPYEDKDRAKALGARWDVARKVWYVIDPQDLQPFAQWIKGMEGSSDSCAKKKRPNHGGPMVTTGAKFRNDTKPSGLLPWEN